MLSFCKSFCRNVNVKKKISWSCQRFLHGECLPNRKLVKVCGLETKEFLQGLMTNDIEHLDQSILSIYTMFLNVQGRVLFDGIIYKWEDGYLIDCDSQIVETLINHLRLHKVRRKLNFEIMDSLNVWAVFNNEIDIEKVSEIDMNGMYLNLQSTSLLTNLKNLPHKAIVCRDPRLVHLGDRIIFPSDSLLKDHLTFTQADAGNFETLRFKFGVGEGVEDFARAKSLPLEANCDYLHGVSFQKGCYIGQELTARTHHTGVVRKRFMPLIFDSNECIEKNSVITNEKGRKIGKVVNFREKYGIGLLRIAESLSADSLSIGSVQVKTFKPGWWPIELSKDRQT